MWNGKGWELLIPDVESVKQETLKQVNKDIQLTKEELNKKWKKRKVKPMDNLIK